MPFVDGGERSVGDERSPLISLRSVGKRYPGVVALNDVSLDIRSGEVHALLGENGAGKTTVVRVLTGAVAPDSGTIATADRTFSELTPKLARELGIAVINQESNLAPDLTLTENIFLDRMPRTGGLLNWGKAHSRAQALLARVGLNVDPRRAARSLRPVEAKLLDIARALSLDARMLILDEPTAVLGGQDSERLFEFIRGLRSQGVAILYISHHLIETLQIADTVTILRDGDHIVTENRSAIDLDAVLRLMLGRPPEKPPQKQLGAASDSGRDAVLVVDDLHRAPSLRGVSFTLSAGESLCITGLSDSGRRELVRCIAGAERPDKGAVLINGAANSSPLGAIRKGLVFLPADRKREGLFLDRTLLENIEIGRLSASRALFFSPRSRAKDGRKLLKRLDVRAPSARVAIRNLSGGNQQKVLLARWLGLGARVYVFDEPTEGIDVGAKLEIHKLLRALTTSGAALLVFSSDYEEVEALADRAIVLARGRIAGELEGPEINDERLLELETR